jgi:Ca2+-dependent lipid-binding protein
VHLVSGHNLVAMDKSGTSDPYVKFKQGSRLLFKSRIVHKELNPMFDETFLVPIEDPFQPINVKVNELHQKPFFSEYKVEFPSSC